MLLASETHFFDQPILHPKKGKSAVQENRTSLGFNILLTAFHSAQPHPLVRQHAL
jgi:hypothetical protein